MELIAKMKSVNSILKLDGDFTIADKVFTSLEDYANSKELKNRFENYEHVMARHLKSFSSYLTFKMAFFANDELYTYYITDDGLSILNLVTISSCVHNGGFRQVVIGNDGFYIGDQWYAKTAKNRKLFIERNLVVIS